ncbi:RNA-directed DNA polymerase, eukaryota, reverse transcriptase zinc-binding domain protein [Tanacetum coccineum]
MGKQFKSTDLNGWTWISRNNNTKSIGNPFQNDIMKVSTSFYVTNMPPALTSKGLWTVCAPYGRLVDAFIANKLSKGGKRFGFIRFLGVNDANAFVKSLSNIWIGSYHIFITLAINQRSKLITNPKPQTTKPSQYPNNLSNQNTFPILSTNITKNATPETKLEHQKPSINPTPTNPRRIIALNDQDLINVVNTYSIILVKRKDIDSMSNMYTICRNGGFSDLNIHHEDSSALSSGRVCISSKSHHFITENVQVEINKELFEATVQEIGSWSIKINDDYLDTSSNDIIKELDISSESIDDDTVDDLEHIQANLNNIDNQDFDQKLDLNEDNKQGKAVIQQPPREEVDNKVSNTDRKAEPSDLSRPPGFEFMKKSFSSSSKCSTSFVRFRKKDIKGVSLIHELNQIIDVGSSPGYDVRVVERGKEENACGSKIFALNTIMARGLSGGLISMWDPNLFSKEAIWCDDSFIIIKGNWKNSVGDCYMDIVGSQPYPPSCRKIDFGPSPFKLYNSWLLSDGFDDLIKSEWELLDFNNTGFPIKCHDKVRILKSKIRQWNNNNKSLDRNRKIAAIEELSSIEKKIDAGLATHSDTENRLKLLHELEDIDKFASMDLIQKARVKWDIERDENSKFFHGLINQKRQN